MAHIKFFIAALVILNNLSAQETRATYSLNGKVKFIETSSYDLVEKFGEIEIGDFLGREILQFNEIGNIIKKYKIRGDRNSKDTSEISHYQYVYNENRNLKEINEYYQYDQDEEKELKFKTKFKYNEAGKLIEKRIYDGSDGSFSEGFIYSYENGEIIEKRINEDDEILETIDESFTEIDEFSQITTYKEELDSNQNWIKKTELRKNKPVKVFERKIIYY